MTESFTCFVSKPPESINMVFVFWTFLMLTCSRVWRKRSILLLYSRSEDFMIDLARTQLINSCSVQQQTFSSQEIFILAASKSFKDWGHYRGQENTVSKHYSIPIRFYFLYVARIYILLPITPLQRHRHHHHHHHHCYCNYCWKKIGNVGIIYLFKSYVSTLNFENNTLM